MRENKSKITQIVFYIERLGDRIALKYVSEHYKLLNPDLDLWIYQEPSYPSVQGFNMMDWAPGLYSKGFTWGENIRSIKLTKDTVCDALGVNRFWFSPGNLFVFMPKVIHDTGRYPTLTVPAHYRKWLNTEFCSLVGPKVKPVICFHPLLDAGYSCSRNHNFDEWEKCIKMLSEQDVTIYRIGSKQSIGRSVANGRNVFDLAEKGYTVSQSMAVISTCDIYIGGDTGMTHAAASLNKKIVGVWGDITHMQRDHSKPNNIQYGDWDSSPYVPEDQKYMLRRTGGEGKPMPVIPAEQILEGINHFLKEM